LKDRNVHGVNETHATQRKAQGSLSSIGEILSGILPSQPPPFQQTPSSTILERMASLEKKVEKLFALIEALTSSLRQ
jgi:hypothetical protein